MKLETVLEIQSQARKLLPIVEQLQKVWERPLIDLCSVLIQNLQFDNSCSSLEDREQKILEIHKTLELLNENSFRDPFMKWLWGEVDCIVSGCLMSEHV